jgi:hypothetical protein
MSIEILVLSIETCLILKIWRKGAPQYFGLFKA